MTSWPRGENRGVFEKDRSTMPQDTENGLTLTEYEVTVMKQAIATLRDPDAIGHEFRRELALKIREAFPQTAMHDLFVRKAKTLGVL